MKTVLPKTKTLSLMDENKYLTHDFEGGLSPLPESTFPDQCLQDEQGREAVAC